ncbi:response regulator [Ferrimonas marina]|uniref:Response regulator containing CheY-like receiver, AAA-type ATPase, and DNA-binding domains n=1 Tax=Ferrimonas marina TaxID=299255 RepID=A0A1M5X5R5_9GAMM|nr:response regulator [Ferrimonas marina]SHH94982.1 Response regulator containing CheY-like receiver, AAA-type ATPase, and DNA-binding domains [Ferrimonas marina]
MSHRIVICDDSALARKQLCRCLPPPWQDDVRFAGNGHELKALLAQQPADLLFLDLNMPQMDGYQVLQWLQGQPHAPRVIVVSADIQADAYRRVMALGALQFLKKPVVAEPLLNLLGQLGYNLTQETETPPLPAVAFDDALQEICNVAMGRAAANMAELWGQFIELPIPRLRRLGPAELAMLLEGGLSDPELTVISQGFAGHGICGEALLLMQPEGDALLAQLTRANNQAESSPLERQMDTANLVFAVFLSALSQQLDIPFCQSHPVAMSSAPAMSKLPRTLAVEIRYQLPKRGILCELLLLLPESTLPRLHTVMTPLMEH